MSQSISKLKFDIMHRDEVIYKIQMTDKDPIVERLTDDNFCRQFYSDSPTTDRILHWLEGRCFPETRADKDEILKEMGLDKYDIIDILHITHGLMWDDYFWIRFPEDNIKFDDIKLRD